MYMILEKRIHFFFFNVYNYDPEFMFNVCQYFIYVTSYLFYLLDKKDIPNCKFKVIKYKEKLQKFYFNYIRMIELYPILSGDVQNLGNTKTKQVRSKT